MKTQRLAQNSISEWQKRIQVDSPRAALNYIKDVQDGKHPNAPKINPNAVVSEGFLRLEQNLSTRDSYSFNVLENQGEKFVTERRLKVSDQFLVTHLGLFVISDTLDLNPPPRRAVAPLQTYNSIPLRAALGLSSAEVVWNSLLEIRVDETVYFDGYDTSRFKRAGTAQEGLEVSTGATNPEYVADEWSDANYGMAKLTPFIFLAGRANNKINLQMPSVVAFTTARAAVVLVARGMQIQNAYSS